MNVLAFDIETIPDVQGGQRIYDLDGLDDEDTARAIIAARRKPGNTSEFLPHHLQRVVAISVALRSRDSFKVWTLGEVESSEEEIITRFFEGIERYTPTLVSWNGGGFDLPVLHYRSLIYGVVAPRYWDTGEDDRDFKWNNYLNRFHWRHTDLMDVLSGYQLRAAAKLDEVAVLLNLPGKQGMSGGAVWDAYLDGKLEDIRNYCESDVLNTYLVYLRWQLSRGSLSHDVWKSECAVVRNHLKESEKPHLEQFLEHWPETD